MTLVVDPARPYEPYDRYQGMGAASRGWVLAFLMGAVMLAWGAHDAVTRRPVRAFPAGGFGGVSPSAQGGAHVVHVGQGLPVGGERTFTPGTEVLAAVISFGALQRSMVP